MVKHRIVPTDDPVKLDEHAVYFASTARLFEHFSPKADVAFVGDSITDFGRWSEFFPAIKVVNRGVCGDKASDILSRIGSVLSTKPKKAFIMVGINDIQQHVPVPTILENYELIVDALMAANVEVIVQSTIQCDASKCGIEHVRSVNLLKSGFPLCLLTKQIDINLSER